jgi:hypothetical protein
MTIDQMAQQPAYPQNGHVAGPDAAGALSPEMPEADKQEAEAAGEYVTVPIRGTEVRVKPQLKWRMSHMRCLNQGDLDGWAEGVIHPDDVDKFFDLDPEMEEFREFSEEAARLAGDSLGKSSGRSRSSKPTRRR